MDMEKATAEFKNPLVVGKSNRNIYLVGEKDIFTNLTTGRAGRLTPEDASKFFNIPQTLNLFVEQNPCLIELIKLGFTLEENKNETN